MAAGAVGPVVTAEADEAVMVAERPSLSLLRTYQQPIFQDDFTKVLIIECSRQIGKSHTLGQWAARRLLQQLQRHDDWLIVLISNSKSNGVELGQKVAAALRTAQEADELLRGELSAGAPENMEADPELGPQSGVPDLHLSDFAQRIEIRIGKKRGRVLVLAASPRTARGFSADLGLDEFAFHENAGAIWDAAYPMLDSNPEFVCRICSTHNGVSSLFNTWIRGRVFPVYSIRRSEAWAMGRGERAAMEEFFARWRSLGPRHAALADRWKAIHGLDAQPQDRLRILSLRSQDERGNPRELTPAEAEAEAVDKASYRQNYENDPADAGGAFLTWDEITRAERGTPCGPDVQRWTEGTLRRLAGLMTADRHGEFYVGQDFARTTDLSVVTVMHHSGGQERLVAWLEMRDVKSTTQRDHMCRLMDVIGRRVGRITMDMTGNGLGLYEMLAEIHGSIVLGVNFSETVPLDETLAISDGRKGKTMGISERMALDLQQGFEDGLIVIPVHEELRADLRKPSRVLRNGRVYLAAARTAGDHADRFWALALARHGSLQGSYGGWTEETLAAAEIGHCPAAVLPAYEPPGMSHFLP